MQDISGATKRGFNKAELGLRAGSGILLAAIAILEVWLGGLAYALFVAALSLFVLLEYFHITARAISVTLKLTAWAIWAVTIASFLVSGYFYFWAVFTGLFLALAIAELISTKQLWVSAGLAYAILPFIALEQLRGDVDAGFHLVTILFFCVWATDSFGYLVGKPVGGPKLAPAISPNKTWSGFAGGFVGGLLLAFIVASLLGYQPGLALVMFSIFIALFSQIGDLIESALKRKFDVKDSGSIIPGHGGVLDRIDGLIFAALVLWVAAALSTPEPLNTLIEGTDLPSRIIDTILPSNSGG